MSNTLLERIKLVKNLRRKEVYHVFLKLDELKDGDFCRSALSKHGFVQIKTTSVYELWCHPTRLIEAKKRYPDYVYYDNNAVYLYSQYCFECDLRNSCRAYNGKEV